LSDKAVLVTGAAGGLGRAILERCAADGASGLCADHTETVLGLPDGWHHVCCDVTSETEVAALMDEARQRFGGLDGVVANAGIVPPWRETEALDLQEWDRVFAVNVRGVAAAIKHAVPLMRDAGGAIVAMGSLNSRVGHARQAAYVASKHAVLGLVRAAALDLGRYGIRVNALAPGPIATEALVGRVEARAREAGTSAEDTLKSYAQAAALGRMASAQEVAAAALYLLSDMSSGVTGQLLPVDAGLT
jgi:NAD(P)-dependent dehydrogenase (short-subunit alcohol dehydrogenase family)